MFYVYILKSLNSNFFYKGLTRNPDKRIPEHLKGRSPSTKNKLPLVLIHVEVCANRIEARRMEKFFKSGFGREIIHELADVVKW